MSDIDFENEETQRATWTMVRGVVLNAMVEAVAVARSAVPTDDPQEIAIRDGMILDQLHVMLAEAIGETEGRILRCTMRTDESLVAQRQERIDAGRVRGGGTTKQ